MKARFITNATTTLADQRQIWAIANRDEFGLDDLILISEGCERALDTPVPVLAGHDATKPIAKVVELAIAPGMVRARIQFPTPGISALADETYGLIREGILNCVSTGFEILDAEPVMNGDKRGAKVKKWRLDEISIVAIGALPASIITARARDRTAGSKVDARRLQHQRMARLFEADLRRTPAAPAVARHQARAKRYAAELAKSK